MIPLSDIQLQFVIIYHTHKQRMDQMLAKLDSFIRSNSCAFEFKPIDYPSEFQQHLITNYFTMIDLLKTHSQTDIVRLLHSSEKYPEVFIPGLLYQMLLQPSLASQNFEAYMPSLRSESWIHFGKLLLHLFQQSFTWIKPSLKSGLITLMGKLNRYGQLSGDLLVLSIKSIDYSDMSENSLNYNNEMLGFFQQLLTEPVSKEFSYILAKSLFYKLFRMLSLLAFSENQNLKEYKMRCIVIAQRLFELQRGKCLAMGNSGLNILKELQTEELQFPFLSRLVDCLSSEECKLQSPQSASMRLSAVLPMKIETTLLFILKENVSKTEIKIQLSWMFASNGQFSFFIIPDVLRYLLALPSEDITIEQCLYILEQLFYRVCTNSLMFEMLKDQLFFSCFVQPCPFPAAPERVLRFLAYLIKTNIDFGQSLLVYLLYRHGSQNPQMLQSLLLQANELQILKIDQIMNHPNIQARVKEELIAVLNNKGMKRIPSITQEPIHYYDPLQNIPQRKESQMSMEFSDSQPNYLESESEKMEVQLQKNQTNPSNLGKIKLEKMFVEDMGENLSQLLLFPSLNSYSKCYKHFMNVIKEFKVSGQNLLIDNYISEIAKVTYLIFQNQFEEHHNILLKEESTICFLLTTIASQWRTNSFQLQIIKKIVKKLIDLFPTCQPTFWRYFLLNFKRNLVGASRQMKQWLIPKQKSEYAVSLIRELGPLSRQLTESAEMFKLPLYL